MPKKSNKIINLDDIKAVETRSEVFKLVKSPFQDDKIIPVHPFRLLISGGSMSGKTTLLIYMILKFYGNFFNKFILISPNAHSEQWEHVSDELGDKLSIIDDFDNDYMLRFLDYLKLQKENDPIISPRVCFVFDDCLDDKNIINSRFLKTLFIRGRHSNLSSIFVTQAFNHFPLSLRKQLSNVITFPTANKQEIEALCKDFCHAKLSNEEFINLFNHATHEPYSFLHTNLQSNNPNQIYRKKFHNILEINK